MANPIRLNRDHDLALDERLATGIGKLMLAGYEVDVEPSDRGWASSYRAYWIERDDGSIVAETHGRHLILTATKGGE